MPGFSQGVNLTSQSIELLREGVQSYVGPANIEFTWSTLISEVDTLPWRDVLNGVANVTAGVLTTASIVPGVGELISGPTLLANIIANRTSVSKIETAASKLTKDRYFSQSQNISIDILDIQTNACSALATGAGALEAIFKAVSVVGDATLVGAPAGVAASVLGSICGLVSTAMDSYALYLNAAFNNVSITELKILKEIKNAIEKLESIESDLISSLPKYVQNYFSEILSNFTSAANAVISVLDSGDVQSVIDGATAISTACNALGTSLAATASAASLKIPSVNLDESSVSPTVNQISVTLPGTTLQVSGTTGGVGSAGASGGWYSESCTVADPNGTEGATNLSVTAAISPNLGETISSIGSDYVNGDTSDFVQQIDFSSDALNQQATFDHINITADSSVTVSEVLGSNGALEYDFFSEAAAGYLSLFTNGGMVELDLVSGGATIEVMTLPLSALGFSSDGTGGDTLNFAVTSSGGWQVTTYIQGSVPTEVASDNAVSGLTQVFAFTETNQLLVIDDPGPVSSYLKMFPGIVSNLQIGDRIDLPNQHVDSAESFGVAGSGVPSVLTLESYNGYFRSAYQIPLAPEPNRRYDQMTVGYFGNNPSDLVVTDAATIFAPAQNSNLQFPGDFGEIIIPRSDYDKTGIVDFAYIELYSGNSFELGNSATVEQRFTDLPIYLSIDLQIGGGVDAILTSTGNSMDAGGFLLATNDGQIHVDLPTTVSEDGRVTAQFHSLYPLSGIDQTQIDFVVHALPVGSIVEKIPVGFECLSKHFNTDVYFYCSTFQTAIMQIVDSNHGSSAVVSSYDFGILHVGDTASASLAVRNIANGSLCDNLVISANTSGDFTTVNAINLASGETGNLTVQFSPSRTGAVVEDQSILGVISHDASLPDVAASGGFEFYADVYNYAAPVVVAEATYSATDTSAGETPDTPFGGTLGSLGSNAYQLDFGTIVEGSTLPYGASLFIDNAGGGALYTDNLSAAFAASGDGFVTAIETGAGQVASGGGYLTVGDVAPDVTVLGAHSMTLTILPESVDSKSSTSLAPITITIIDQIISSDTDQKISTGILAASLVASSNHLTVLAGGSASSITVAHGGIEAVQSGGIDRLATIYGGHDIAGGSSYNATVFSGGVEVVTDAGIASGTTISSGGMQAVLSGASAIGTIVSDGGLLVVDPGSVVSGAVVQLGAAVEFDVLAYSAGGIASVNDATHVLSLTEGNITSTISLGTATLNNSFVLTSGSYGGTTVRAIAKVQRVVSYALVVAASILQADDAVTSFTLLDSADRVAAALNMLSTYSKLTAISFSDFGTPNLSLTGAQYSANASVLGLIISPYILLITGGVTVAAAASLQSQNGVSSFTVADSAGNVAANLATLAGYSKLSSISLTGTNTQQIFLTQSQQTAYQAIIAKIVTPYTIVTITVIHTDSGTTLQQAGASYQIVPNGGAAVALQINHTPVTSGEFGAYAPIGAVAVAGGYEVAYDNSSSQAFILATDTSGNYTSFAALPTSNTDYSIESQELAFGQDLNGDGTTGPVTSVIAANGALAVEQAANVFAVVSSGGAPEVLNVSGTPISAGHFAGYNPVAVLSSGGAFEVMFKSGSTFLDLDFNASGNFTSAATGFLAGSSYALEGQEAGFGADLNHDGTIGLKVVSIASNGALSLLSVADEFEITSGGVVQAILQVAGSPIISGQFVGYDPVAVLSSGGAYEVMFKSGSTFLGLDFNASGNFTSAATSVLSSGTYALESLDVGFNVSLDGTGQVGPVSSSIAAFGPYQLNRTADAFTVSSGGVLQAVLQVGGSQIVSGNFGGYSPIAALANAGGYEVMFKSGTTYVGLEFNSGGTFTSAATSVLSSGTYALESLDVAFNVSLDGTGQVGPVSSSIATFGPYQLNRTADAFTISSGGVLQAVLQVGGSQIVSGNFGGYSPIAALANAGGYEVMFKSGTTYVGLEFNSGGNFTSAATSVLSSGTYALESLDVAFNVSLDGTGQVGPVSSSIAAFGPYQLNRTVDAFTISSGGILQAVLQVSGNQIVSGQFAGFNPVALQPIVGGYEVMFQGGSSFIGLDFNSTGNFTTAATALLAGSSYALESLETGFGADINGDGTVGPITSTIATNGAFALVNAADAFEVISGGTTAILQVAGSQIVSGQFAGFAPVAVLSNTGGYEVMFQSGTGFIGLDFDASGNFTSAATALLSASSPALWAQEVLFGDDLNKDGQIGTPVSTIQVDSGTALKLSGTAYTLTSAGGAPVSIAFGGTIFTSVSSVIPIGAIAVAGGYEVAWDVVGQNEYAVWKFDTNGNYVSPVTTGATVGLVTGQDFSLEQLEPAFGQDLNGDGRLSMAVFLSASSVNLSTSQEIYTATLVNNNASATGGLSASTLSVTGTVGVVTVGSLADTIELTLTPATGIDQVVGFKYGVQELNIDLNGAAPGVLQAAASTYNGAPAITLYSNADPTHGFILTGYGAGVTAANIINGHTTFVGGHALIS